jgi:1-acyl-sn-glycerol-3-phosphate acyltransferase
MYEIMVPSESPLLSQGSGLIVGDHSSMGDPLVLLATAGRPIRFMMAQEIYDQQPHVNWVFQAFRCIPLRQGKREVKAVKAMLEGLTSEEVMGVIPRWFDQRWWNEGHPGIGYLALKSGVPVIPASIVWGNRVRYPCSKP